MKARVFLACVLWTVIVGSGRSEHPQGSPEAVKEEAARRQEMLARQYQGFEQSLLRLMQRLEKSGKPEDQERAGVLRRALELSHKEDVRGKFDKLIATLNASPTFNLQELKEAMARQQMLAEDIRTILALLFEGGRHGKRKEELVTLEKLLQDLDRAIREQEILRASTDGKKQAGNDLARLQKKVAELTRDVERQMGKRGDVEAGRQQVRAANEHQRQAEENLQRDQHDAASQDQDRSIRKLEESRRQLEKILRQLRQEEVERVLAALKARCERMLHMQIEVQAETVGLQGQVAGNPERQPTRANDLQSVELSKRESLLVAEATKAIKILETEGSAVAFPEVFVQVRDDMRHVERRLGKTDVGMVTQVIERDIIATLREMVGALQKSLEEHKPEVIGRPEPPLPGKPQSPRLLGAVAELKMIKAMQERVNHRTESYGAQSGGEQAGVPEIQKELKELSQRQQKISEITSNIAKEKNK